MKNKNTPLRTSELYKQAETYRKYPVDEAEIEKINMTEILEREENIMIEKGEIIKQQINAKMRLGKSTMAIARAKRIYEHMQKTGKTKDQRPFGMKNICRDEIEHSKRMRLPETTQTILIVDEANALENTGENVTAEQALKEVFSNVQAGRYVHQIDCTPKGIMDDNSDIILSIIATDKEQRITRAKLYYRYHEGESNYIQLLGYVDTYVGNIIHNWIQYIEPIILKEPKTPQEQATIKKYQKKDFYVEYMIKKYEKMELITKEGIFRPRMLDYAEAIIKVINQLKNLTKIPRILSKDIVKNYIKIEFRNAKIPTSIIGMELATNETNGILELYKSYYKTIKDLNDTKNLTTIKKIELENIRDNILQAINIQLAELEKYSEINKKYNDIQT